ncbi:MULTISPECIES: ThuA domain-containing protein [Streptacidiphilus]|uniref:ThuA domain-containing protein n=1 Tax=Streptacidiphilus cavernicola TaxID=3342716 RepID=A0ABV6UVK4_9ACTN|nr:ThuA domain-containing protein [Streptacidiphilus jeojiense]
MTTTPRKQALVVRGGWEGHVPVAASDRYAQALKEADYQVTVSDTLDSYLDQELLAGTDLVVQCWTMGEITGPQAAGLSRAVRAGTGFAGWHGGIVDSFRGETAYQLMTGGQFVHHPSGFVTYRVRPVPERAHHPALGGITAFTITTEQYYLHLDPANDVLAVTDFEDDPDNPGLAGTVMPVTWTRRWGAGRVFVTTLGHNLADLETPQVDTMIKEGMAWATR